MNKTSIAFCSALFVATLASGEGLAATPTPGSQVPFEARAVRRLDLFRGGTPKKEEMTEVSMGTVVTVLSMGGEKTWEGKPEQVVKVGLDDRSTYYALRSQLEPLDTDAQVSIEVASALLFSRVPKSRRSWCAQMTRRMLLSSKEPRALVYSASTDSDCAGYVALVAGTGKSARVLAHTRREALQAITVHEFPSAPPVLDVTESLRGNARLNGIRRSFLGLDKPFFQELLAMDIRRDELEKTHKRSSLAEVEVRPSRQGLDIEVRRVRLQIELATGAESNVVRDTQSYQYAGGKLSARTP